MARRVVQKAKRAVGRKAREPIATTPVPSTEQTTAQTFVSTSEAIESFDPQSEDGIVAGESDLPEAFIASNADAKGGFTSAIEQDETGAYDDDGDDDEEDLELYVGDVEENNDGETR